MGRRAAPYDRQDVSTCRACQARGRASLAIDPCAARAGPVHCCRSRATTKRRNERTRWHAVPPFRSAETSLVSVRTSRSTPRRAKVTSLLVKRISVLAKRTSAPRSGFQEPFDPSAMPTLVHETEFQSSRAEQRPARRGGLIDGADFTKSGRTLTPHQSSFPHDECAFACDAFIRRAGQDRIGRGDAGSRLPRAAARAVTRGHRVHSSRFATGTGEIPIFRRCIPHVQRCFSIGQSVGWL